MFSRLEVLKYSVIRGKDKHNAAFLQLNWELLVCALLRRRLKTQRPCRNGPNSLGISGGCPTSSTAAAGTDTKPKICMKPDVLAIGGEISSTREPQHYKLH